MIGRDGSKIVAIGRRTTDAGAKISIVQPGGTGFGSWDLTAEGLWSTGDAGLNIVAANRPA